MTSLEQYLDSVKNRLSAATPGYSLGRIEERNNWCIDVPCPPSDSGLKKWPLCEFYGGVADVKPDVDLILSAPQDLERMVRIIEVLFEALTKPTFGHDNAFSFEFYEIRKALIKADSIAGEV